MTATRELENRESRHETACATDKPLPSRKPALRGVLTFIVGIDATPAAAATCASLTGLASPDTMITAVQSIPAGSYAAPDGQVYSGLPAFCRVTATLTPTSDSSGLQALGSATRRQYSIWREAQGRYPGSGSPRTCNLDPTNELVTGNFARFGVM
jgi:hypothetical protein